MCPSGVAEGAGDQLLKSMTDLAERFALSSGQVSALEGHKALLLKWNRIVSLVSPGDLEVLVERHYGESLFLAGLLPRGPLRVVDVGSGGGFPGVPLAVARPDCHVTLVDSNHRKAAFLREATRGWENVEVVRARAGEGQGGGGGGGAAGSDTTTPQRKRAGGASAGILHGGGAADRGLGVSGSSTLAPGVFDWLVSRAVRWTDLAEMTLASQFALLMGAADAEVIRADLRFSVETVVPLCGSESRVAVLFHVER